MKQTAPSTPHTVLNNIGNTPLVELSHINPYKKVRIYGKLEGNNPGGSVKDRAAYYLVKGAVARGDVKPGMQLIEATSGNTGIALAMIACLFGVDIVLVIPENATRGAEFLTMQAYGATVGAYTGCWWHGRGPRLRFTTGRYRKVFYAEPV